MAFGADNNLRCLHPLLVIRVAFSPAFRARHDGFSNQGGNWFSHGSGRPSKKPGQNQQHSRPRYDKPGFHQSSFQTPLYSVLITLIISSTHGLSRGIMYFYGNKRRALVSFAALFRYRYSLAGLPCPGAVFICLVSTRMPASRIRLRKLRLSNFSARTIS